MSLLQRTRMYRFWQALTVPALFVFILLTVDLLLHPLQPETFYNSVPFRLVVGLIILPLIVATGLLCMLRVPGNILGPLLIFLATGGAVGLIRDGLDPTSHVVVTTFGVAIYWTSTLLFLLYFPDGKPYFRRVGKWVERLLISVLTFVFFSAFISSPTLTYGTVSAPSPFYIPAAVPVVRTLEESFVVFGTLYLPFVLISLVSRYRFGNLRERQQLKWLLWSLSMWAAPQLLIPVFEPPPWLAQSVNVYSIVFSHVLPLAVGLAIVRNQLYDIDIIIRKTLVYSVLTALLAGIYFGSVVLVQQLIRALTGETSDLAIVLSTLLIAALFSPLRRRIQETIDRRFYRRKYDAQQTLARFSQSLRDEVDIEALQAQLAGVVQETMQPEHVRLWLQMGTEGRARWDDLETGS